MESKTGDVATATDDDSALDRRRALKAALGGAAAAAVLTGPGIKKLGTAPAYAQQATRGTTTMSFNVDSRTGQFGDDPYAPHCWGFWDGGLCVNTDGETAVSLFVVEGLRDRVQFTETGDVFNGGTLSVTRYQTTGAECSMELISAACNGSNPAWIGDPIGTTRPLVLNQTVQFSLRCATPVETENNNAEVLFRVTCTR